MSNNAQLKLASSPTQRMINNNFHVMPVYDKEMTTEERKLHEEQKCANFDSRCKFCVGGRGRRIFHRQKGFKFGSLEQEAEHLYQPNSRRAGCRPLRRSEHNLHTMHEVDIDFTTVTKKCLNV